MADEATQIKEGWLYCLREGRGRTRKMPEWTWTGDLRPHRISPLRRVPSSIPRPDYANDPQGYPKSEAESEQQTKVPVRSAEDIEGMRAACRVGRQVLDKAHESVKPGVTTDELDRIVHEAAIEFGAYPSPLNYYNFPKSVCASVNEVVCHGIPDGRELENGDIVNLDVTVFYNGYNGDLNETYTVGEVDDQSKQLIKTTHDALFKAIAIVKPGTKFRELGNVISRHAGGYGVVRAFCGHGICELFHCAPNIPHYKGNKTLGVMKAGMTFTIEPMINLGSWKCKTWPDGWTAVTEDGKKSAQFEHTILVTPSGADVLTKRLPESPPLWWQE